MTYLSELTKADQLGNDFVSWYLDLIDWSELQFGTRGVRGCEGPLKHLQKEVAEALSETDPEKRKMEIVDCLFLVIDASYRAGMDLETLLTLAEKKLEINRNRKWAKNTPDGAVEHVRDEESQLVS